jgi:hypothetical protein
MIMLADATVIGSKKILENVSLVALQKASIEKYFGQ